MSTVQHAYLTTEEVAARYRVSANTIREWAANNLIPSVRTPGGRYRFVAKTLDDFDRKNQAVDGVA